MTIALDPDRRPQCGQQHRFLGPLPLFRRDRVPPNHSRVRPSRRRPDRHGPGYRFADELPKPGRYELGSLAMANAGPDTNGSQFFVISGPQGVQLPPQYSLFGKIVSGMDVVAAIDAIGSSSGTPKERVTIESVTVTETGH